MKDIVYCPSCGEKLIPGKNFCPNCGLNVSGFSEEIRKITYEGVVRKCPNCGEALGSFSAYCPACGYELRDKSASDSVQKLYDDIRKAENDKEVVHLIRIFPVPNDREDIFEFMVLASSNFSEADYISQGGENSISGAWFSKASQCFQKARLSLKEDDISKISKIYDDIRLRKEKAEAEKNGRRKPGQANGKEKKSKGLGFSIALIVCGLLIVVVVLTVLVFSIGSENDGAENVRAVKIERDTVSGTEATDSGTQAQGSAPSTDDFIAQTKDQAQAETYAQTEALAQAGTQAQAGPSLAEPKYASVIFSSDSFSEDLEITDYNFVDYGNTLHCYIIKNNTGKTTSININETAYDESGNVLGASSSSETDIPADHTLCMIVGYTDLDEADHYEAIFQVRDTSEYNIPVVQDVSANVTDRGDRLIVQVTNNGQYPVDYLEATILFFKGDELVYVSTDFITDGEGEIKAGATLSEEIRPYFDDGESYDSYQIYFTGSD